MRLFIAIELNEDLTARMEVELRRLARIAPHARWARPSSLHLSLAFLGEVEDALVPRLEDVLTRVAARHSPHTVHAEGSGTFGPLECPKVLWAGLSGELDALRTLERTLVQELALLNLAPDHLKFVPHVTLARARHPRGDPALGLCADALRGIDFGDLPVREVVLFESIQDQTGMRYRPLVTRGLRESKLAS